MQPWEQKESSCKGGTRTTFPFQLYALLTQAEALGLNEVITWLPSGDKFVILKPNIFAQRILPKVFRQTKFSSFKRQLNAYGFQREITSHLELDKLVYFNDKFHRDRPAACAQMIRRRPGDAPMMSAGVGPFNQSLGDATMLHESSGEDSGENIPNEKPPPILHDRRQISHHQRIMDPIILAQHPSYQQSHYDARLQQQQQQQQEIGTAAAMFAQPQYGSSTTVSPDSDLHLSFAELTNETTFGANDSVLDELAEFVVDEEEVKGMMDTPLGGWDTQVEASLSRTTNNDESYNGVKL